MVHSRMKSNPGLLFPPERCQGCFSWRQNLHNWLKSVILTLQALARRGKPCHQLPMEFSNVTAVAKANVYFEGKVVSHTILFPDGAKKTLGLIYPGSYHFGTDAAERMEISDGQCTVLLDGGSDWASYAAGTAFEVPAKSGFEIRVEDGICQYVCSFLS